MKHTSLTVAMVLLLAGPASVLAEEHVVLAEDQVVVEGVTETIVSETVMSDTAASTAQNPAVIASRHSGGMMHKGGGQYGKGHGGMKHGGMKHGGGQHGKGHKGKHDQVVKRLDMIEVRLAKIEAMLEILMRR